MPNYILSRTSPPAHIYERKINLGYGIKVDTSDAPPNQTQKGKEMNDAKEVLDVADKQVDNLAKPVNADLIREQLAFADGAPIDYEINAFASATALDEAEAAEKAKGEGQV